MGDAPRPLEILELMDGGASLRRALLDPHQIAQFPIGRDNDGSRVIVLSTDDLTSLLKSLPHGLIIDRGTKHRAKALSTYLAGRGGLLALRAHYVNLGQARRGLRALVQAAERHKTRASYFVGVNSAIFTALSKEAEPLATKASTVKSDHLRILLQDPVAVPDTLRSTYIGTSDQVEWVRRSIVLAARMDHPVLIQGETGTGKEVVAREIHLLSGRRSENFVPVNCGGIPADLFESELFGHTRGSFTGATRDKQGFWTMADRGTLFLDEVGDLSLPHQVKVLRALEDGRYFPVGAEKEIQSKARIIAATNRDLSTMVQTGQFREDLYYRLFAFRIRTPTLAEHPTDIPQLARRFWTRLGDGTTPPLTEAVAETLLQWTWPGNARELRSFLINLLFLANGRKVDVPFVRAVMHERLGPAQTAPSPTIPRPVLIPSSR